MQKESGKRGRPSPRRQQHLQRDFHRIPDETFPRETRGTDKGSLYMHPPGLSGGPDERKKRLSKKKSTRVLQVSPCMRTVKTNISPYAAHKHIAGPEETENQVGGPKQRKLCLSLAMFSRACSLGMVRALLKPAWPLPIQPSGRHLAPPDIFFATTPRGGLSCHHRAAPFFIFAPTSPPAIFLNLKRPTPHGPSIPAELFIRHPGALPLLISGRRLPSKRHGAILTTFWSSADAERTTQWRRWPR
jgi:hypothetical protein